MNGGAVAQETISASVAKREYLLLYKLDGTSVNVAEIPM